MPVAQLDRASDSDSEGRWFESSRAYQNVLMKDAAQKTPRKSAVFSHIYQFFRCKKLENEIFQRHDLRARAVRVGAEH